MAKGFLVLLCQLVYLGVLTVFITFYLNLEEFFGTG